MRSSTLFTGLLGVVAGFFAVVSAAETGNWALIGIFGGVAVLMFLLMAADAESTPKVVVVGRSRSEPLNRLEESLDLAGYATLSCTGPNGRDCPVEHGRGCPLDARHPVGAIIYLGDGLADIPPCEKGIHAPAVAIERDPASAPHPGTVHGRVAADDQLAAVPALQDALRHR